jgi:hypothetical protein
VKKTKNNPWSQSPAKKQIDNVVVTNGEVYGYD